MPKYARHLVAWTCITLLATFIAQSNAAMILCVATDHTAVEAIYGGDECSSREQALGAPDSSCKDTLLSQASTAAAPERIAIAALPVTFSVSGLVPAPAVARLGSSAPPPPRDLDRARSSTVLLI